MALSKYRLGDLIEFYKQKCGIPNLTPYQVSGVNKEKEFFEPSNQVSEDTSKYQNVPPKHFACNLMHIGRDCVLPIAFNHSEETKHVSPAYTVFKIKNNKIVLDFYFFMLLKSNEKDRFFWFNCDASVRDGMSIDDFKNIEIELPDIETQQKFVNLYLSMVENQKAYERGLDDLKLVCDGYIEDLRKKMPCEKISNLCHLSQEKNTDEFFTNVKGLTVYKQFIDTKAEMDGVGLNNYKIVHKGDIAYVPTTNRNGDKIACGLCSEDCIISSIYEVIKINDNRFLLSEYLFMWFKRTEIDRYARYHSWGSARETISWEELGDYNIPIPSLEIQKSIVEIFNVLNLRKQINEKLKEQIKNICPVLIKGSIEEARGE